MITDGDLPGFAAATRVRLDDPRAAAMQCGAVAVAHWGIDPLEGATPVLPLSRVIRTSAGAVPASEIAERMSRDPAGLMALLPPFGAVACADDRVRMVADSMGFRQLYHTDPGLDGPAALSTSALLICRLHHAPLY